MGRCAGCYADNTRRTCLKKGKQRRGFHGPDEDDPGVLAEVAGSVGLNVGDARDVLTRETHAAALRAKKQVWTPHGITDVPAMMVGGRFPVTGGATHGARSANVVWPTRPELFSRPTALATPDPMEWITTDGLTGYQDALTFMEQRVEAIARGDAPECIWLLEHPPLYTAGTSANPADLIEPDRFEVFQARRGGQYTYHGPGQRVVYVMLDLNQRGRDVRAFVKMLEDWVIAALDEFNITGLIRPGRVGVWVERDDKPLQQTGAKAEDKIAAIGIRLRKWISFHGISINVDPDLEHFSGIVPCGITEHGVTSLVDLGLPVSMADLDVALRRSFDETIGA